MSGGAATPPRFPWLAYWLLLAVIFVIGMLPFITFFVSIGIADAYGCTVNESAANACMIGGSDMGSWLQFGAFSILYVFVTWPLAFVLFLVWLLVLLVHRSGFRRRSVMA